MKASKALKNVTQKAKLLLAALLLLSVQTLAPISAFTPKAEAAPICVNDTAGANDEPGQKDLTKLCVDYANVPTSVTTTWNWDNLGTTGANTMDGCSLFDTDNDGNINYAVCVTTQNTPAAIQALTTYSCGDGKIDRCTSTASVISSGTTACEVGQENTDPFPTGTSSPVDTEGSCVIQLSTVGGAAAKLVDVCSYPSAQPNSDPSDCVIARNDFGKVELVKQIEPDTDPGLFNLTINGPESNDTFTANNVGDGGTTGEKVVKKGTVVVSETAGTNTSLSSYNTTIVCKDLNGTGATIASGSPTGSSSRQLQFTLVEDADVVCTITNTRQSGTIKLIKNVVNDNGGQAGVNDFGLSIGGTSVTSGQALNLSTGSYAINEAGLTGYQFVSITGTGCPAQLGGNVNLTNGQNIVCTITNNDVTGKLKVIKNVINNDGGTAQAGDFTISVNGQAKTQGQYFNANAGTYTVTENGPAGYTQTDLTCVDDTTQQEVAHPVNLALAQSVTCTVENNDVRPLLTVTKIVTNDNGGTKQISDFPLFVNATGVASGSQNGFNAGSYVVSETNQPGYTASITGDCDALGNVTLHVGDVKSCTITNNDIAPLLTVIKYVVNDNGGLLSIQDFALFVGATQVTSGVPNPFDAGDYTVSETNQPGYTAGAWGGDCATNGNITLSVGGSYTCSITNDDQPGTLIVKKVVVNDDGGTKEEEDFTFKVNGSGSTAFESDGQNDISVSAGTYSVVEDPATGYDTSYENCTDVFIPNGGSATCTITNNDQEAKLTVIKHVVNDNGGLASADDFTMNVTGNNVSDESFPGDGSGTTVTIFPGNYSVDENAFTGYAKSLSEDCAGSIALGEHKTCTITNNDIAPLLTVIKYVTNDNGGLLGVADFNLYVGVTQVTSGVPNPFTAGSYTVSEDNQPGYTAGPWGGDCAADGSITLTVGGSYTCTITNNDQPGKLIVKKAVTNDNGGTKEADDFSFTVNDGISLGFEADGENEYTVNAGTYSVVEDAAAGYTTTYDNCDDVAVANGETETCTIANDDQTAKIKVTKVVVNDNGGEAEIDDFTLKVNDTVVTSGASNDFDGNASYTIGEGDLPKGYTQTGLTCSDTTAETTVSNPFEAQLGHNYECTITNDDVAPTLKIVKKTLPSETDQTFTFTSEELNDFDLGGGQNILFNDNLQAGSYTVTEEANEGWKLIGIVCEGATYATEDNFATISLGVGDEATCEFTNEKLSAIDGFKFEDVNHNGEWDEGEPTLEGWTITLAEFCPSFPSFDQVIEQDNCEDAVEASTVTDENGYYRFENLNAGLYIVCEDLQGGWIQTYPWGESDNNCHFIELSGAGDEQQADFGNFEKGIVEGSKFNDVNGNHVWDENELGLEGWEITLTKKCIVDHEALTRIADCEDETWTATTDEEGAYSFVDLMPGEYTVCETQKDKWTQTYPQTEDGCHAFVIGESGQVVLADFGNKAKPQVLDESTTEKLVNTGAPTATSMFAGLIILSVLGGLHFLTRRKVQTQTND